MILGTLLLAVAFLAALGGAAAAASVIRGFRAGLSWMRLLAYAALACAALSSLLLLGLILAQRYDVSYVYQYTSRDLALGYRLAAFWAGPQGSFLLWLLLAAILTVLQIRRSRQLEPYVLFFTLLVQAALAILLLADNPFLPLGSAVVDGLGMHPLLQNPWMVAHPPALFVGYAGLTLPFAYALAGLWRRDYDEWAGLALPWALLGWFFLGLGIYLGAYWSYETLGWGGYWGWDLVENSSLIPWLTGTALLHGLLIQRYRQRLRQGNLILAIGTFLLILYAACLTRSGILGGISNHSFVASGLAPWMAGLLLIMTAVGVYFLVARWRDIPRSPVFAGKEDEPLREGDLRGTVGLGPATWLSRDLAFLLAIVVLLFAAAPVWIGTVVPVVSGLLLPRTFLVDVAFYPRTMALPTLLLLLLLCVCPLLGWQESAWRRLRRLLAIPALLSIAGAAVAFLLGVRQPLWLLFVLLGTFALAANILMIVRAVRGGVLRLGGYLTHVGVGLVIIGIVASAAYNVESPVLALAEGQPQSALGYSFTFLGWQETPGERPALRLDVQRSGERFIARPALYSNPQDNSVLAAPYIRKYLAYDLYIAANGYDPGAELETVSVSEAQTVYAAGYTLTLRSLTRIGPDVEAVLDVGADGQRRLITATYPYSDTTAPLRPVSLPGGGLLAVGQVVFPPPGEVPVIEGDPTVVGNFTVMMLSFSPHGPGGSSSGIVLEVIGPGVAEVITPTLTVGSTGEVMSTPIEVAPGIYVQVTRMAVEQRMAWVKLSGIDMPSVPGVALLNIQPAGGNHGVARVQVSIKPGINLLWLGGLLLLLGTLVALLRRWREGRAAQDSKSGGAAWRRETIGNG